MLRVMLSATCLMLAMGCVNGAREGPTTGPGESPTPQSPQQLPTSATIGTPAPTTDGATVTPVPTPPPAPTVTTPVRPSPTPIPTQTPVFAPPTAALLHAQRVDSTPAGSTPLASPTRLPIATPTLVPMPIPTPTPNRPLAEVKYATWWSTSMQRGCTDRDPVEFGSPPMALENIVSVGPYGLMVGGHVIPSDHAGLAFPKQVSTPTYDVLAVADGEIVNISVRTISVETGKPASPQYHVEVRHSCAIVTKYDLIDELEPSIAQRMDGLRQGKPIPVKEGQAIGKTGFSAQGIDFWVADLRTLAPGYIVPKHYEAEPWRLYAIEPFTLFKEPLRTALRDRSLRREEPRGGRADYDIDGRLIGGWFVEGTNGYAGRGQSFFFRTHLAIAPHAFDPSLLIVSLGDFAGQARQFAVTGNGPDPATIDISAGVVKYELRNWTYSTGEGGRPWDYKSPVESLRVVAAGDAMGTLLVQLIEIRRLKVELFPGKPASAVTGFTDAAAIYER